MEIRENSVLHANNLRRCGDITPWKESFGAKLDAVMDLLDGIPDEEQGIIFVQSYSMMGSVCQALTSRGIPSYAIDRISETASDKIEAWVSNKKYLDAKKTKVNSKFGKVLILNLGDESASGMNLVNANHVIFIAPLLTNTNQKYQAAMVQSIGRARRYGQQKPVHVYRFVAPKTIDMDILEQRELRNKALSEEPQDMAPPFEPGSTDYEKTKAIKDAHGTMMIVPRSWVADVDTAGRHGIELGVSNAEELERFTSITQFSEAYVQDGDV
ncbi:SNF2-related protein [Neofusicoccum parvum]|nr:SNF2-related protein [Neofusicoccum parvum]